MCNSGAAVFTSPSSDALIGNRVHTGVSGQPINLSCRSLVTAAWMTWFTPSIHCKPLQGRAVQRSRVPPSSLQSVLTQGCEHKGSQLHRKSMRITFYVQRYFGEIRTRASDVARHIPPIPFGCGAIIAPGHTPPATVDISFFFLHLPSCTRRAVENYRA